MIPTSEGTLGPFFPPRYVDAGANDLTVLEGRKAKGEVIEIVGRVTQEDGAPLENLVIEIWQPDAAGIFGHAADQRHAQADPNFFGWGRAATDAQGNYAFRTIRPGASDGRVPHVNFMLMYSGLMRILKTTMYFGGFDVVLQSVPEGRRKYLLAKPEIPSRYRFDIRLRGADETPFFDD